MTAQGSYKVQQSLPALVVLSLHCVQAAANVHVIVVVESRDFMLQWCTPEVPSTLLTELCMDALHSAPCSAHNSTALDARLTHSSCSPRWALQSSGA